MKDLTISQQYLICCVNKHGKISGYAAEKRICLIAAALLELRLEGSLRIEQKKVISIRPPQEGYNHLQPLYDFIAEKSPIKILKLLDAYNMSLTDKKFQELFSSIGDSLSQLELVTVSRGGLLKRELRYLPSPETVIQIIDRLRTEFLGHGKLAGDSAAMMVLLERSKLLKEYFSKFEQQQMKDKLQAAMDSADGQLVRQMVVYIEQVLAVISIAAAAPGK